MPKILLVEDNEMNRDMLSRRLAREATKWCWQSMD
jgi:CheY-like chemotaxis protein